VRNSIESPLTTSEELAIKIFKTNLNEFKNRSEYVDGEYRFRYRHREIRQNSRKLIKLWAEKEIRNLKRLQSVGIPCPIPIVQRENILIMSFIGKDGVPAPRLRDVEFSNDNKLYECYLQCVKLLRKMYQSAKLIHADFSEYNILYRKKICWIIDVAQAMEFDHPNALEFLKKDCTCISDFFKRKGVSQCMTPQELFNFTVDLNLKEENIDHFLDHITFQRNVQEQSNEEIIQETVFQSSFTPRTLCQVKNPIQELFEKQPSFHMTVNGLTTIELDEFETSANETENDEHDDDNDNQDVDR